jgi:hypothetical protein
VEVATSKSVGPIIYKEALYVWNEVATPYHKCKEKYENHPLCT